MPRIELDTKDVYERAWNDCFIEVINHLVEQGKVADFSQFDSPKVRKKKYQEFLTLLRQK